MIAVGAGGRMSGAEHAQHAAGDRHRERDGAHPRP